MRTFVLTLSAVLFLGNTAYAQTAPTTPISSCAEIVGQRHNPYDEPLDLDFSDQCNYTIKARGRAATGVALLNDGTLTIKHTDQETGVTYRFALRRSGENLSGRVSFWVFVKEVSFPIQFFPVKK